MGLEALRGQLDRIDAQILSLLSDRAAVILQVADWKRRHNSPVHVPAREAAIIQRLCTLNVGPLSEEALTHIYQAVLEAMRGLESRHVVGED